MSQVADAEIEDKAAAAAGNGNEHDSDDLCEVDIPFSIIDGSSDDEKLEQEQPPGSSNHAKHTEKINENIVLDCFNFSVNAHIKGKFEQVVTKDDNTTMIKSEANEGKNIDKCIDKDDATVQNQVKSTSTDPGHNNSEKGWFPAPLPLPAWAALD